MIINQSNLAGLNVGYSTAFNKAFQAATALYKTIATEVNSSTSEQSYKWLGQFPQMKEWIGEREIQSLSAYGYTIKNKKFEMSVAVPRDDIEDDQYGVYTPLMANMGECASLHPDSLTFKALHDGFTNNCYDGKTFFSANHKVNDKTFSNLSTKQLSVESYEAARAAIMSITGDKDKSLNLVPDVLVVPPALEKTAKLILEADQIDGTTNVNKGTAKVLVSTELAAYPTEWYLLCTNKYIKPIIFQKRKEIKFVSLTKDTDTNVFMADEYVYGADGRSNVGYSFWQMAYGSKGTDVAQG